MGDPELRSDEKVLVRTPGVYVKSIPFEGILTNKRIILVDRAKNLLPPKEIPLVTIKEVEPGENAIRDQIITLSVMAKTGETRQMILTFSRQAGGNRIKERDAWIRTIRENASSSYDQVIRKVIPTPDPAVKRPEATGAPRYEVVHSPSRQAVTPAAPARAPVQPVDDISPVRRIVTSPPAPAPAPVVQPRQYDTPAPEPVAFCPKCGNRVPAESVFCNRCGSPIAHSSQPAAQIPPVYTPVQQPPQAAPSPVQTFTYTAPQPAAPVPSPQPAYQARPIDEEIQSIEPLIARETTRVPPDILRTSAAESPLRQPLTWDDEEEAGSSDSGAPAGESPEKPAGTGFMPRLFSAGSREEPVPGPVSSYADYGSGDLPPKPPKRQSILPAKRTILMAAAGLVVILIIAAAAVFVLPMLGSISVPSGPDNPSPAVTTTTSASTSLSPDKVVVKETPAVVIPKDGVYVHVSYLGGFKGSYGISDDITTVPGNSGDRIWEVENATNTTVHASFEKLDGSAHEMVVEIYKDGKLLSGGSTTVGHGSVTLAVDMVTGKAATPITSGSASSASKAAAAAATTAAPAATSSPAVSTTAPPVNTTASAP